MRRPARTGAPTADVRGILGANLAAWFRSDLGVTIGTGVSQWSDQSGRGNHVTQGTGAQQPTYVAGVLNGKPVLRFANASSQFLRNGGGITGITAGSRPCVFVVARHTASVGNATILNLSDGDSTNRGMLLFSSAANTLTARYRLATPPDTQVDASASPFSYSTWYRQEGRSDSATVYSRFASTEATTAQANTGLFRACTYMHVGTFSGGGYFTGDIAEIIVTVTTPTAAQISALRAYIQSYWGV